MIRGAILVLYLITSTTAQGRPPELESKTESWGLKNIEAHRFKPLLKNNEKIVVAVIDTGSDIHHSALKDSLWINKGEIPNNNIDDDGNGWVDDIYGWNFVDNNGDVRDFHGHGTHISGIINSVADNVELMIVKYYDPRSLSDKNLHNTVRSIDYAIKNGAHIINYSGGGFGANPEEEKAIQRAKDRGIIFVAAAGNDTEDSDAKPFFPASYDLNNIVSVASLTEDSSLVTSSNFGKETIDIAAPGESILSALPGGRYGRMTGTSQATAFVTGALSLVIGAEPGMPYKTYIQRIVNTGKYNSALDGKTKYQTNLNAYRAMVMKGNNTSANGIITENTKLMNIDMFSASTEKLESILTEFIENADLNERTPAQMAD